MKIALVIEHFNPARGGAETYTASLLEWLARQGHEVTLLAEDWSTEPARATLVQVPVKGITAARRYLSFSTEASELAASGDFDVVHSMARILRLNVFHPHGGVTRASLDRSLASSGGLGRGLRKAARWLNTKTDILLELENIIYTEEPPPRMVAVSKMVAEDMKRYYDVDASRIEIVHNGVDTKKFSPEGRESRRTALRREIGIGQEEFVLLIVAHNYRLKGVEIFIRVIAELEKKAKVPVRGLVVGGRGGEHGIYPQLVAKMGLGERVSFHEAVSNIAPYYSAADVYVHPTFYDPMSLVVLEALSSGLPVVTTQFNGCCEIMTEGVEGFCVADPRDIATIMADIELMLDDKRRADMSAAARVLAKQFPLEKNFEGIMGVYEKAAADPRSRLEIRRGE